MLPLGQNSIIDAMRHWVLVAGYVKSDLQAKAPPTGCLLEAEAQITSCSTQATASFSFGFIVVRSALNLLFPFSCSTACKKARFLQRRSTTNPFLQKQAT
jgi:hypothetical protein